VSYGGRAFLGLTGDNRAAPHLDLLSEGVDASVRELCELSEEGGVVGAASP
jgi:hypothetical protein